MSRVTAAIAVPRLVMIPWAVVHAADPRLAAMVTGIVNPQRQRGALSTNTTTLVELLLIPASS